MQQGSPASGGARKGEENLQYFKRRGVLHCLRQPRDNQQPLLQRQFEERRTLEIRKPPIFGCKNIEGKFVEIKKDEANSEWVIINDAIIDGKPYNITKMSITDIVSIVDTNRTLTLDSDVERRPSATSGYESRPLSRASRSTTATPNGTPKDPAMVRSKSQTDLWRLRTTSGTSTASSGSSYAAIVKAGSSSESVTKVLATQSEAQIPQLNAEQEKMVHSSARAKTPTPRSRTPAARPKTPTTWVESALTPQSNPIMASKFMDIVVTNADWERPRLYLSLPTPKPLAQPEPNFRIQKETPVELISAPVTQKKTGTYSPLQPDHNDNLYNKKRELCAVFTKFAQRRLQKESEDKKIVQRTPDFCYAILRACDQAKIKTKDEEIRPATPHSTKRKSGRRKHA